MSKMRFVGWAMMLGGYGCVVIIICACWTGEYESFFKSVSENLKVMGVSAIAGMIGYRMLS